MVTAKSDKSLKWYKQNRLADAFIAKKKTIPNSKHYINIHNIKSMTKICSFFVNLGIDFKPNELKKSIPSS